MYIKKLIFLAVIFFLFLTGIKLSAEIGPENTVVIVNSGSSGSKKIADEYVKLRKIPPQNVIKLTGIKNYEHCTVEEFRENILKPILKTLDERGIRAKIDCIAYSTDFPWRINCRGDLPPGRPWFSTQQPYGSINGLTFLYQPVLKKDYPAYVAPRANFYVRLPKPKHPDSVWTKKEQAQKKIIDTFFTERSQRRRKRKRKFIKQLKKEKKVFKSSMKIPMTAEDQKWEKEQWFKIKPLLIKLRKTHPYSGSILYQCAQRYAVENKPEKAIKALQQIYDTGWWDAVTITSNPDFNSLKKDIIFQVLIKKMKNPEFKIPPAIDFHSTYSYLQDGTFRRNGTGRKYLLSMVLGVTNGRGNSVKEIIEMLRRSKSADGTNPDGTIYIAKNKNIRSTLREWAFKKTVAQLKSQNIKAEIVNGILPQQKDDIAGAVLGTTTFDWEASGSKILPGAICEHLTSYGGNLKEKASQDPISKHIRHGACGSAGTVVEPYAMQTKFPIPYLHCYYTDGYSMAESFYLTISQPYQILLIGDPLCKPWKVIEKK